MRKFTAPITGFLAILVLSLQLITCGAGGGDGTPTAAAPAAGSEAPKGQYTIQEVVDKIYATLGEDRGFSGIALGMDKGYSIGQIAQGAMTSRLFPSGDIINASGATVIPKYPASNLIEARLASIAARLTTLDFLRDAVSKKASKTGYSGLVLILSLCSMGYSAEQIIEGIMLDYEVRIPPLPGYMNFSLYDLQGNFISPNRPGDADAFKPPPGTGDDDGETPGDGDGADTGADPMPWTYSGTVYQEYKTTANWGAKETITCTSSDGIIVILGRDGALGGVISNTGFDTGFDQYGNASGCRYDELGQKSISGAWVGGESGGVFSFTNLAASSLTYEGTYNPNTIKGNARRTGSYKSWGTVNWSYTADFNLSRYYGDIH